MTQDTLTMFLVIGLLGLIWPRFGFWNLFAACAYMLYVGKVLT